MLTQDFVVEKSKAGTALSSYNNWEWWWQEMVGGEYHFIETDDIPQTGYYQDEEISCIKN